MLWRSKGGLGLDCISHTITFAMRVFVATPVSEDQYMLAEAIPYFIPEHVQDPTIRTQGEELWVEVTVPPKGLPRPKQVGVKKDGRLTPLNLR